MIIFCCKPACLRPLLVWGLLGGLLLGASGCEESDRTQPRTEAPAPEKIEDKKMSEGEAVDSGMDYFPQCLLCHGASADGNQAIGAPNIAAMETWYLRRQLELFRRGGRGYHADDLEGAEMRATAAQLSDADIAYILRRLAALDTSETARAAATVSGDIGRGESIYATCGACHGARAEGDRAQGAPALAGIDDWYLVSQLKKYKDGLRGARPGDDQGARMRAIALTLTDDRAIQDVVAYINTLH